MPNNSLRRTESGRRELPVINVSGRMYARNPEVDRYQIGLPDLDNLRMCDIPPHSHLEIMGLPTPDGAEVEVYGLNPDDTGSYDGLCVYGGVGFRVGPIHASRTVLRLQQAFPHALEDSYGFARNPQVTTQIKGSTVLVHLFLNIDCSGKPDALVRHAVAAYAEGLLRLTRPSVHAFVCYASEDRIAARELAQALSGFGADVWLDEREIRVGDSIVERINDALGIVSHFVLLLSNNSVSKPWVQRELSSALMLQLSRKGIQILPVRLDDCQIPPILTTIRYADARNGMEGAVNELERTLYSSIG